MPDIFTERATESCSPVETPLVGDKVSQVALSETDQFKVPPPEFQTSKVWFEGLDPPWVAMNEKLVGEKAMVGLGEEVVNGCWPPEAR